MSSFFRGVFAIFIFAKLLIYSAYFMNCGYFPLTKRCETTNVYWNFIL